MAAEVVVVKKPVYHTAGFPRSAFEIFRNYFADWQIPGHVFNYESWYVRLTPENPEWRVTRMRPFFTKQPSKVHDEEGHEHYLVEHTAIPDVSPKPNHFTIIGFFVAFVDNELNECPVSIEVGIKHEDKIVSALSSCDPENEPCSVYVPPFTRREFEREGLLANHWHRELNLYEKEYEEKMTTMRSSMELTHKIDFVFTETTTDTYRPSASISNARYPYANVTRTYVVTYQEKRYKVHEASCEDLRAAFERLCSALNDRNMTHVFESQDPRPTMITETVRSMTPDEFKVLRLMKYAIRPNGDLHQVVKNYWDDYAKTEMVEIEHPFTMRQNNVLVPVFLVERAIQNFTVSSEYLKWIRTMHNPGNIAVRARFKGKPNAPVTVQINCIYAPNRLSFPPEMDEADVQDANVEPVEDGTWFACLPFPVPKP